MPDMRFAPPNPLRIADRATGLNSVSVRSYNERLVLSLLLQRDAITRLEIGEKTGLSAQTISVLVRSLEQEGLVAKGEAQKGRVGPPTVPLALNPEGAFSIGISVGRHHTEMVLIDFVGTPRFVATLPNPAPEPGSNHSEFLAVIKKAVEIIPTNARDRLAGVGLALPHIGAMQDVEERHYAALQVEIEEQLGIPVFVQNDITAAASGESMFGIAKPLTDYLFVYLGAKLHGRLVLNHQIYHGNSAVDFDVGILALQRRLDETGAAHDYLWQPSDAWPTPPDILAGWENAVADQIVASVAAVGQFLELDAVVLSSPIPKAICESICKRLTGRIGNVRPIAGSLRPSPKATGAASLPFSSRFMVE